MQAISCLLVPWRQLAFGVQSKSSCQQETRPPRHLCLSLPLRRDQEDAVLRPWHPGGLLVPASPHHCNVQAWHSLHLARSAIVPAGDGGTSPDSPCKH